MDERTASVDLDSDRDVARGLARAAEIQHVRVDVDQKIVFARAREGLFAEASPPIRIGRFLVMERVGAGGMGIVYAAYDPVLDRKIAVKVLRTDDEAAERQRRLLREARALAKISHPHVVAVHDVGTLGEGASAAVFIAMEFVDGTTLRTWIERESPPWRTRMDVLAQAGRGLAAAHAAGLVHRDFKPDNVMVSRDGPHSPWRARVMDFGLVQPHVGEVDTIPELGESTGTDTPLTHHGIVVGTPAYMAPEQLHGLGTDTRTDQFGFCVTAWEALHDVRPFVGDSPRALAAALLRDDPPRMPATSDVPTWIRRVLLRGLSRAPDARFADMDELLAALDDDPTRRRRRRIAAVTGVAAIAAVLGGTAWTRAEARAACVRGASEIDEIWNAERRDALETSMLAPSFSYGADTWARVEPRLESYAARWAELSESNCVAASTGTRSRDLAERSEDCLDEHRAELAATLDALAIADATAIREAVPAVLDLPDLERCDDVGWLAERRPVAADLELRVELGELRSELARAARLRSRGSAESVEIVRSVLARATALDWTPMRLDAELALAPALSISGDAVAAADAYRRAFALAVESGDVDLATRASTALAFTTGYELGQYEQAAIWADVADAFVARSDPDGGVPTAWLLNTRASIARLQGRYEEARRDFERATEIRERVLGLDQMQTLQSRANLAVVLLDMGEYDRAEAVFRRNVEARARLLGPEHPDVGRAMSSLAAALGAGGRVAEALDVLQRALAIEERALGPTSPLLATTLHNLGTTQEMFGDLRGALATHERQLAIREAAPHTKPSHMGEALLALARVHVSLDQGEKAMPLFERARGLLESGLGPDHPSLAVCFDDIAELHQLRGDLAQELPLRRRALEIREAALGAGNPDTASARSALGDAQLRMGDSETALQNFRTSLLANLGSIGVDHHNTAVTLSRIASLHHQRGELATALELARSALILEQRAPTSSRAAMAFSHDLVGRILVDLGEPSDALPEHEAAVRLAEAVLGVEHTKTAVAMIGLADAEHRLGRLDDAESHARRAFAILQPADIDPMAIAEAELVLGEILHTRGQDIAARSHLEHACAGGHRPDALRLRRCPRAAHGERG